MKNIEFKYEGNEKFKFSLSKVELANGALIGLSGRSGSGKSTFIDLLLGLIYPQKGEIITDSKNIIKKIGFLPQDIFISEDTIENNIINNMHNLEYSNSQIKTAAENCANFISYRK